MVTSRSYLLIKELCLLPGKFVAKEQMLGLSLIKKVTYSVKEDRKVFYLCILHMNKNENK
jgi:hypothetical protein